MENGETRLRILTNDFNNLRKKYGLLEEIYVEGKWIPVFINQKNLEKSLFFIKEEEYMFSPDCFLKDKYGKSLLLNKEDAIKDIIARLNE